MHPVLHHHNKNMNGYGDNNNSSCCYFHPKQVVVGVCPLCLNERLLVLAAKQGHHHRCHTSSHRNSKVLTDKKLQPNINYLPKIFSLGSFLNRFEFRHWKSDISDEHDACSSQEDSFISIKFEDNGNASWEKGTVSKVSLEHCSMSWKTNNNHSSNNNNNNNIPTRAKEEEPIPKENNKSVIEHAKHRGATLRWRKRIGHLLQLVRWKRSNKEGNVDHGVKIRKGWIRTLTKRGGPKNKGVV